ncbi:hypothetical protein [Halomonas huangheensis]|uniref:Uncharacterized protein n=1 Tax=Halomonas huangheensis TaxID=1178482 RepID=W1NA02_9GAMM|nr:hypothetical protein [Halomonas huangheensis]ALM53767.1 hypothetical protein AR456_16920 [Halomonas huangheensis]ERL52308.1 hypothetical protein BJB45_10090 [Halomonas huangheensis]
MHGEALITARLLVDRRERRLLMVAIGAFLLLCFIEARLSLPEYLSGTVLEPILLSGAVRTISVGVLVSLVAAYIFYLLIDYFPRSTKEAKSVFVLNSLLAAVLDSYDRCRVFGHETALPHVNRHVLEDDWLEGTIVDIKDRKAKFLPLKLAMQTAHTRLDDFRNALVLAVNLSPEHALQWLVIIDKIRLFTESYREQPEVPEDKIHLADNESDENPLRLYKGDLRFRFLEVVEESQRWLQQNGSKA